QQGPNAISQTPHPHSSNSLLSPMDHAFGPNYGQPNLFPPTPPSHLGALRSPGIDGAGLSSKFMNSNLSPSTAAKLSPSGPTASFQGATHHRPHQSTFEMLNNQSPLSNAPSSIITSSSLASNSPG